MDPLPTDAPPHPPEPVGTVTVHAAEPPVTLGELRFQIDDVFTPLRVGSSEGTHDTTLRGALGALVDRDGPKYGQNIQQGVLLQGTELFRMRLATYRWQLIDASFGAGGPRVELRVDRVAHARNLRGPSLQPGESRSFWLSSCGVQNVELETSPHPDFFTYVDYVQLELYVGAGTSLTAPWYATLHARRALRGYQPVSIDLAPADTESRGVVHRLGDHSLEVLDVVPAAGVTLTPAGPVGGPDLDLHVHVRLTRGASDEGMFPVPPPPAGPQPPVAGPLLPPEIDDD
jgi:hypothetical protein